MQTVTRQAFPPEFSRQVSANVVRRTEAFKPYLEIKSGALMYSEAKMIAVFIAVLNEHILHVFMKEYPELSFRVIDAILTDHLREPGREPKDLQVNLISNLIMQHVRAKNIHTASRYAMAEEMVRACELDTTFKLALKVALFDRRAVQSRCMMIHPYREYAVGTAGNDW